MSSQQGKPSLPAHLLHLATLQLVTRSSPFTHARTLPLHTLSHLVADYLQLLARSAKDAAELAGRTDVAVWDLGRALDEFGMGTLDDLSDELELGTGDAGAEVTDDGQRLNELAANLKERTTLPPSHAVAQLTYDLIPPAELHALFSQMVPEFEEDQTDDDDDDDDESELATPEPFGPPLLVRVKEEDSLMEGLSESMHVPDVIAAASSSWRDPELIPSYVPSFLPPFPGMEKQSHATPHEGASDPSRRRKERDWERDAVAASLWDGSSSSSPWVSAIPYASSSLAEAHPASALPPLSPPPSRRRLRSLSPPAPSTSLPSYRALSRSIAHAPTWPRPNPKRRIAASSISVSSDMSLSSDTLFGGLPVPPVHSAALTPGFLPEIAVTRLHPFNTSLPHTVALPAAPHPSPHAAVLAPPPHPRISSAVVNVTGSLSHPTSDHLALFSRLTRMGPPGPLGPNGEALEYEYIGQTALLASNVEWPVRVHNARLAGTSRQKKGMDTEENGGTSGIRLNLKLKRGESGLNQVAEEGGAGTPGANAEGEPVTPSLALGTNQGEEQGAGGEQMETGMHEQQSGDAPSTSGVPAQLFDTPIPLDNLFGASGSLSLPGDIPWLPKVDDGALDDELLAALGIEPLPSSSTSSSLALPSGSGVFDLASLDQNNSNPDANFDWGLPPGINLSDPNLAFELAAASSGMMLDGNGNGAELEPLPLGLVAGSGGGGEGGQPWEPAVSEQQQAQVLEDLYRVVEDAENEQGQEQEQQKKQEQDETKLALEKEAEKGSGSSEAILGAEVAEIAGESEQAQ